MNGCRVDTSGLSDKLRDLETIANLVVPKTINWAHDEVMDEIDKYLSGPHYKEGTRGPQTGKVPIPRISGKLAASMKTIRINKRLIIIYSDHVVAPWNKMVHDGTKWMKARPFVKEPVNKKRPAVINRWRYETILEARKRGRQAKKTYQAKYGS